MKVLAIPTEEEFESLPPALRRKFFSNVERFRMRQAHSDPNHVDYQFNTSGAPRCLHFRTFRNRPTSVAKSFSKRRRRLENPLFYRPSHKRGRPGSLHAAYAQIDSLCFNSLPPKIQQTHFSKEEQLRLRKTYCDSVILDAADEAFYRLEKKRERPESQPLQFPISQSSTLYLSDSDSDSESDKMDETLYDSFRWLDEDRDLDLRLDEYHAHIANSPPKPAPKRRPSFRRTLSLNSANLARRPSVSISHQRIPTSSHSSAFPSPLTNTTGRTSISRPSSSQRPHHAPRSSTSSIDPSAQYYQDPDARLKLRVYLASPQKFDEAVEFGFPALENEKKNIKNLPEPKPKTPDFNGTFFREEDEMSIIGEKDELPGSRLSKITKDTQSPTESTFSRQSVKSVRPQRLPGNREMTLKMTLTRPDLRTDSPSSPSVSPSSAEVPFKLDDPEFPPATVPDIWDSDTDDQSIMKKMWRKFRKRC